MRLFTACLFACSFATVSFAQGTKADYARADNLRRMTAGKVFKARVQPRWFDANRKFWYRNVLANGRAEFVLVDVKAGTRKSAFDHGKLAAAITPRTKTRASADRLPFREIGFNDAADTVYFRVAGKTWKCDLATYTLSESKTFPRSSTPPRRRRRGRRRFGGRFSSRSADRKWRATIENHNIVLMSDSGKKFTLTKDGTEQDAYQPRFYWSPDSKRLVVVKRKAGQKHTVYMVESSPRGGGQPKLHQHQYLKPGDRIAQSKPHLFDVEKQREIPVDDKLFANPYRISDFRWRPDSGEFTLLYNQRGHQVLRIVGINAATGKTRAIVDEKSKTFIDYAYKKYARNLDESGEIIWMSERNGWNHLYLYDAKTGRVKNQITKGKWVVRGVDRVDTDKRQVWFRASGIDPTQDPYYIHYCRVNFDGSGFVRLTRGDGTHAIEYSPDRNHFIDTYSRVDMPPVTELRRTSDGKLICKLERADWSALLKTGWRVPQRFAAKARDGKTDIFGVIYRPTNFDPKKKYPVTEKIYAGPHGSFVPKEFRPYHRAQALAELGFIVVQIDGMGTSNRSKAFHNVCWKNLGDSGFPDRILWMKAAAKKVPAMDLSRVGIYGGSAGGQSALRAMLAFGDFYKAAAADCGCHDNRMDKIWWNELWMGWPIGPHYKEQSNVTNAHKLKGKLLLTVGELDRNVDPASTMQVVKALIKANKDFELIVFPGGGHGIGGSRYGVRRRRDFFVRHLLGVEPRR